MRLLTVFFISIFSLNLGLAASTKNNPTRIQLGTNQCDHVNLEDSWFVYTASDYHYLVISTCGKTEVDTYCEVYHLNSNELIQRSDDCCSAQSEIKFIVEPDSSYLIRWRGIYADASYEWDCYREEIPDGDYHSSAIGFNKDEEVDISISEYSEKWFKYVSVGYELLRLNTKHICLDIYEGKVDDAHRILNRYRYDSSLVFSTLPGKTYYFKWVNENEKEKSIQWMLESREASNGESFDKPIAFPTGEDYDVSSELSRDIWFSYSPDSTGVMHVFPGYYSGINIMVLDKESGEEVVVVEEKPEWDPRRYAFVYTKGRDYLLRFRSSVDYSFSARDNDFKMGENKYVPIKVGEGVHCVNSAYPGKGQWFRYVPSYNTNVKLLTEFGAFASTVIQLIDEKSGVVLESDTCENDEGAEAMVTCPVVKDRSYLIYIGKSSVYSSLESFGWELKENANDCFSPKKIHAGQLIGGLGNSGHWFTYTTTQRCWLGIKMVNPKKDEQVDYSILGDCDSLLSFNKSVLLEEGTEVLIKTKGKGVRGDYYFEIHESFVEVGSYDYPIAITEGTYLLPKQYDVWYVFTPETEGKIEVEVLNDNAPNPVVQLYRNYNDCVRQVTFNYASNKAAIRCIPNDPIYIKWPGLNSEDITFRLTKKDADEGDVIQTAIEAKEGLNLMDKLNRMPTWYYYVPKNEGHIEIKTCDLTDQDTYVSVWDSIGAPHTSIYDKGDKCGEQSYVRFRSVKNDTVYVVWYEDYIDSPYNWSLIEEPFVQGDYRGNALEAVEGVNQCGFSTYKEQWFKYVAKSDGRIYISNCEYDVGFLADVEVFEGDSKSDLYLTYDKCDGPGVDRDFNCKKGATYFIKFEVWQKNAAWQGSWDLKEVPYELGEKCEIPKPVQSGLNVSSAKQMWFTYTAKENVEINLSTCGLNNSSGYFDLQLNFNCNWITYNYESYFCDDGKEYSFQAIKDSTYLFNFGYMSGDETLLWTFEEIPYEKYGCCQDALEAVEGINHITDSYLEDRWYKFYAPLSGIVELSSLGLTQEDTKVELFDGCPNGYYYTRIYSSDNYSGTKQSELSWDIDGGKTYYICWYGDSIKSDYKWELTYKRQGDYPELPLEAELGENFRTDNGQKSQYFRFRSSEKQKLYEVLASDEDKASRKIDVWRQYYNSSNGIEFLTDSTRAELINWGNSDYIIECKGDVGESYAWSVREKDIDTISINQSLKGQVGYINNWFVIDTVPSGYYFIENSLKKPIDDDFEINNDVWENSAVETVSSFEDFSVYLIKGNDDTYVKWKVDQNKKKDYSWSVAPYLGLAENSCCEDARLAMLGDNYLAFDKQGYTYKLRVEKSGGYTLSADVSQPVVNDLGRIIFTEGQCGNQNNIIWLEGDNLRNEIVEEFKVQLDSVSKDKTYYINFDFRNYTGEIKEFTWNLALEKEYDVAVSELKSNVFVVDENPNQGQFRLLYDTLKEEGTLRIFDVLGRLVYSEVLQKGSTETQICMDYKENGIYLLYIDVRGKEFKEKILISDMR